MNPVTKNLVLLLLSCLTEAVALAQDDEVELTFAPIDGLVIESDFTLRTEIVRDDEVVARYTTRNLRELEYQRGESGWELISTPQETELDGARDPVEKVIQEELLGRKLVYELDDSGNVVAVSGFDGLGAALREELPGQLGESVTAVINEDSQTWKAFLQHQSTFGDLAGRTVTVGETWTQSETVQSPFGIDLEMERITEVAAIQRAGGLTLVLLRYSSNADPDAFRELLDSIAGDGAKLSGEIGLSEIGERVIDAHTLNLISERTIKVLSLPVQLKDGTMVTEKRIERQRRRMIYPTFDPPTLPGSDEDSDPAPPSPRRPSN